MKETQNNQEKSNKCYIYNIGQINFYLQNGLVPLQFGTGKLGDAFAVFDYTEHTKVFSNWIDTQSDYKMINLNGHNQNTEKR